LLDMSLKNGDCQTLCRSRANGYETYRSLTNFFKFVFLA